MQETNLALYKKGIPFEKYFARFAELMGLGSQIEHNNFDPSFYPLDNHNIVDAVIKDKALFECTNPEETTFLNDKIMLNKLDYFTRKDPAHLLMWFLIVSFAVFSNFIKSQIDKLGITLIVLNRHATDNNRKSFISHLFRTKLYSVFKRLKPKISGSMSKVQYSIKTIPQYAVMSNRASLILNYLHQHKNTQDDTPKQDSNRPIERFPDRPRFLDEPRFNH